MAECSAARIWTVSPGYEQGAQQMKERACLGPGSVLAQPLLAVGRGGESSQQACFHAKQRHQQEWTLK